MSDHAWPCILPNCAEHPTNPAAAALAFGYEEHLKEPAAAENHSDCCYGAGFADGKNFATRDGMIDHLARTLAVEDRPMSWDSGDVQLFATIIRRALKELGLTNGR